MRVPSPIARPRRGTILPLLSLTVTMLFAFVALAIDVGVLTIARTDAQNGCDAAALAGARVLNNRPAAVNNDKSDAIVVARNTATSNINVFTQQNKKYTVADNMTLGGGQQAIEVGEYTYNSSTQRFDVGYPGTPAASWSAVKVRMKGDNPTFFAKVVGINSMPWETYAVAVHRPRDIAIILDFSGSMQFGSIFNWENGFTGSGGQVYGMMNPDPIYPQFGHYQRYTAYDPLNSIIPDVAATSAATPGGRPNPFRTTKSHVMDGSGGSSEVTAPANLTVETPGGPPMILDFRFDPSNRLTPANAVATPTAGNLWNAFNRWMQTTPAAENLFTDPGFRPAVLGTVDQGSHTERTFNWASYNAYDMNNQFGPTPAPDSFATQSNADATYVGDRYPRKGGRIYTDATTWDPTTISGAAHDARDVLSTATAANTALIGTATTAPARTTAPTTVPTGYTFPSPAGDGGTDWTNFRDDVWERYGYDLDVAKYSGTNPASTNRTVAAVRTTDLFQGFSMGPGYYGKTFFAWPPDPRFDNNADVTAPHATNRATDTSNRPMHDWRRRFFYRSGFTEANATASTPTGRFDPQADNDTAVANTQNINQVLLNAGTGRTLNTTTSKYKVNYRAVLAWLTSGPQVLPSNLRAGRIVYYTKIPTNVDDLADLDKRFWRDYIDFVLGYTGNLDWYDPAYRLAGNESRAWPEGGAVSVSATAQYGTRPRPYMSYTDTPSMPRLHFWFGPLSMLAFLNSRDNPNTNADGRTHFLAGTVHEAQCWQLKAAMNSALDDIKNNHPNDYCSLVYFSNYNFQTPRVTMGQDWLRLKNALFYPSSLLTAIQGGDTTTELRPYNAGMGNALVGNIPNANGGTDPVSGFAMAFNTMANSSAYAARSPNGVVNGGTGRRGASKLVIFETDGVPNGRPQWAHQAAGYNSYYKEGTSNPGSSAADDAIQIANRMKELQANGGQSLPNSPCMIHAIGFGDLFSTVPAPSSALGARAFLRDVQNARGVGKPAATDPLPAEYIITGPYQTRIDNLKSTLERIMQSGVQVTLVQ